MVPLAFWRKGAKGVRSDANDSVVGMVDDPPLAMCPPFLESPTLFIGTISELEECLAVRALEPLVELACRWVSDEDILLLAGVGVALT